jgi:hypothetical protein
MSGGQPESFAASLHADRKTCLQASLLCASLGP